MRGAATGRPGLGLGHHQGGSWDPGSLSRAYRSQLGAEKAGEAWVQTTLSGSALHK